MTTSKTKDQQSAPAANPAKKATAAPDATHVKLLGVDVAACDVSTVRTLYAVLRLTNTYASTNDLVNAAKDAARRARVADSLAKERKRKKA